jgi:hypothetical protein
MANRHKRRPPKLYVVPTPAVVPGSRVEFLEMIVALSKTESRVREEIAKLQRELERMDARAGRPAL